MSSPRLLRSFLLLLLAIFASGSFVNLASCSSPSTSASSSSSSSSSAAAASSSKQQRRKEEKRTAAASSSSSSRILFPGEGGDDDDLKKKKKKKKKRNNKDVDGAKTIVSRHFTVDPNTGVPFALSPVLSFPSSNAEREEEDEEDEEEKVVVEEENPLYKGYYCPRAEHRKCEDTDSPEKYHGVDAWTIDETFSGVSPPENVPQSAVLEAARAPSSWYTLGLREGEGESVLREVLRQRRRGGVVSGGSGSGGGDGTASRRRRREGGEEDDDDDEGDEWWMRTHENAEAFYEDDEEETSSSSSSAVSSRNRKVEDAFNGAMRVLQFHDPDLERVRRSTKYKNVKHRGEETMRAIIEERFGKVKVVLREFLEKLSSSIEQKSPMEVYIELVQIGNCFRASGELGDADYATDAFELALIARSIARTTNVEVYIFYGEFKMNLNELPAVKALLQEGLKYESRNQPMYFALGNVCANQGQWDEAIAAFGKAVEILPGHARSREALEAAKKHAVGSNRRMYAALCLLLLAVLACSTMITFLMSNGSSYSDSGSSSSSSSSSSSKEKKAKESKKRK